MTKTANRIVGKYLAWENHNLIYKAWESEDYDNVMVYENVDGQIICIERDANGTIVDAWEN